MLHQNTIHNLLTKPTITSTKCCKRTTCDWISPELFDSIYFAQWNTGRIQINVLNSTLKVLFCLFPFRCTALCFVCSFQIVNKWKKNGKNRGKQITWESHMNYSKKYNNLYTLIETTEFLCVHTHTHTHLQLFVIVNTIFLSLLLALQFLHKYFLFTKFIKMWNEKSTGLEIYRNSVRVFLVTYTQMNLITVQCV